MSLTWVVILFVVLQSISFLAGAFLASCGQLSKCTECKELMRQSDSRDDDDDEIY